MTKHETEMNSTEQKSQKGTHTLQVWEFSYDVEYGSGIALVAATDLDTAIAHMQSVGTGFGRWVINYTEPIKALMYECSDNVQVYVITSNTYAE